jgi:hypothetical protein
VWLAVGCCSGKVCVGGWGGEEWALVGGRPLTSVTSLVVTIVQGFRTTQFPTIAGLPSPCILTHTLHHCHTSPPCLGSLSPLPQLTQRHPFTDDAADAPVATTPAWAGCTNHPS